MNTLDSIRAAFNSSTIDSDAKVAMLGYSGGAIATEWAAEFAPTYAPDINERLIGAAMGGVLVDPAHNLHYVEGSWDWAGVMAMALVGIARAFEIDFEAVSQRERCDGSTTRCRLRRSSTSSARYPGLKWEDLAKPEYPTPESIPLYVKCANKLIMGTGGTPTIPLFIGQGADGELEGTPGNKPGIGAGDGVMIAGDVRTLARGYCAKGTAVHYEQYDVLEPRLESPALAAELDRLDQAALRRTACAAELFVDPAGQPAQADSGSIGAHPSPIHQIRHAPKEIASRAAVAP